MNKNCYRIIFSKAKNMFIAVAENIKSQTKTTGQSTGLNRAEKLDHTPFHQTWQVKGLVASISLFMSFSPVYAQMQADPNAQASQRASIGVGQNQQGQNIPVVNIQTPKNGVSHNIYNQFDVLQPGVVLNNSRTGAKSVLVGKTAANPFLNTGEARIILNEVNSSTASQFKGNLEVAGQRADVIIANPAGINIQGGGFINANKVTFTTGKPQLNIDGSIQQFVVDQGRITVSANPDSTLGLGGDTNNNANYVDIYTRALELNAQIHAKENIQVITGTNTINADLTDISSNTSTATKPEIALDVKALGGMYAKSIYVVGTEKGLGINNAGTLQSVNNLVITNAGKIEHTGVISPTGSSAIVSLVTTSKGDDADINISGKINAKGGIKVVSGNNLNVNTQDLILESTGSRKAEVILNAQENFNLSALAKVQNLGGKDISINANNINLGADSQIISNIDSIGMYAENNLITDKGVKIFAEKNTSLAANNNVLIQESEIKANRGALNIKSLNGNTNNNLVQISDSILTAYTDANIYSAGDVYIKDINNSLTVPIFFGKDLNIYSGQNLNINLDQTVNKLSVYGNLRLEAEKNINLIGTQLKADGEIKVATNSLEFDKKIEGAKGIDINVKQDLNLNKDIILTSDRGNIKLTSLQGKVTAENLKASSAEKVSVIAYKDVSLTGTSTNKTNLTGAKGVTVASVGNGNVNIVNTDLKASSGSILVNSELKTSLVDTTLDAGRNIELFAKDNLVLDGVTSTSWQDTALNSKKNIYINSQAGEDDIAVFSSSKKSQLQANRILSVVSDKNLNFQNTVLRGGAVLIEGDSLNIGKSTSFTGTGTSSLKNDKQLTNLNGNLTIQTSKSLSIDPKKLSLDAQGNLELISKNGALTLIGYSGDKGKSSAEVVKLNSRAGGIRLEGTQIELQGSQLNAEKDINLISSTDNIMINGIKNKVINTRAQNATVISILNDYQTAIFQIGLLEKPIQGAIHTDEYLKRMKLLAYFKAQKAEIERNVLPFFAANNNGYFNYYNVNGYEHEVASLKSNTGHINLNSAKGISISGADLTATKGTVNIEANGPLNQLYTTTALGRFNNAQTMGASIIIDGLTDFYEKGHEDDANYSMRTFVTPSKITGNNGVSIRAVGKTNNDNIVMQGTAVYASNGDITVEADKNILFDAVIEQSYDRSSKTERKKSWGGLKKKTITTNTEVKDINAGSVEFEAKNILIESKERNPNNTIDIFSGNFTADGGKISIRSGGNLNFYTVEESSSSTTDVTKKSSFAGIKYNNSKTSSTRAQTSEIPAKLKADYIGSKSGFDIRLVGTEFEYLQGATIESGGQLELMVARNNITDLVQKEKSSLVWQSMQDKGTITETAQLPRFNGPTPPIFKADGGLVVQIPIGEQDQNKVQIKDEILRLANQPGNEYLKDLVNRNDVDWNKIILAQKDWDYKSQGLTGAAAAIIVIIVAVITYGAGTAVATGAAGAGGAAGGTTVGMGASMLGAAGVTTTTVGGVTTITGISTLGAMANAAVTTLATQASVSLINNGGDVGKTLKDLVSKNSIRNLATSVVTAGVISQLGSIDIMKDLGGMTQSTDFIVDIAGRTGMALINSGVSAAINTGINGGSLSENLEAALLNGLASSLQGSLSEQVGLEFDIENKTLVDEILHKVAHIAAGCVAGAIQQQCEAGAIGAGVGEIVAGYFDKPADTASQQEKDAFRAKVLATTKVVSGTVAALTGYDVNIAAASAESAVSNNYLTSQQVKNFHKEASDCKSNQACLKNVDNKYFGKTVYDNQGNVISGFYGANQEAFRNCNTTECRIQHGTALIAGQLAYNELNQDSINPNLWIKAKSYITNGGIYSYVGDKDQTYVNGVSQVLGFIEAKCGGALNEACQAKWIERNDQQKSAFLTLGGLLLSPAVLKTVSYSVSTLRGCLVSPTCSTNLKITIDAAITDGSIYGAGAATVALPSKQILQRESSKLGAIISNAFKLEVPDASLGLCFSGKECFVAGTLVETDQGLKPIEKFIGGELVWSRDDITLEYGYKPVIGLSRTENQPIYEVVTSHPNGKQEKFETTQEHPFWVKDIGWLKASLLKSGMIVYDRNNEPLTIVSQVLLAKVDTVYNIEVEGTHTYHVGELGVWVHNACCNVDSLKFILQKLQANGDNPLLKNGGKQINQISNSLMKDADIENLFRILNLPQIQNAKGAANFMSAFVVGDKRPSVLQALNYADEIIKSNPKAIIEFEAKRITPDGATTDILVKNTSGVVTHAIEFKSLDVISPPSVKDNNLIRNITKGIEQLQNSQPAQTRVVVVELRNSYSDALTQTISTAIQKIKNSNPNIQINVQFADGVGKVW